MQYLCKSSVQHRADNQLATFLLTSWAYYDRSTSETPDGLLLHLLGKHWQSCESTLFLFHPESFTRQKAWISVDPRREIYEYLPSEAKNDKRANQIMRISEKLQRHNNVGKKTKQNLTVWDFFLLYIYCGLIISFWQRINKRLKTGVILFRNVPIKKIKMIWKQLLFAQKEDFMRANHPYVNVSTHIHFIRHPYSTTFSKIL